MLCRGRRIGFGDRLQVPDRRESSAEGSVGGVVEWVQEISRRLESNLRSNRKASTAI